MRLTNTLLLSILAASALAACDRTVPKKPMAPTANKTPNKTTGGLRLISTSEGTPGFTVDAGPGYSMLRYTVNGGAPLTPGVYLFHGVSINGGAVIESCNKKVDCLEAGLFNPTADGSIVFQPTQAMIDGAGLSVAMIQFKLMAGDAPEPTEASPLPVPTGMSKLATRCPAGDTTDPADCVKRAPAFKPTTSPMTLEEAAVRSLLAKYQAVSAISGPLAGQLRGQPNAVLTAISEAIISVRALPQPDLQTFIDSLTGAITSDSAVNKLKAISALRPFISTWDTTLDSQTITLPLVSTGTYNFTVDWGDGSTPQIVTAYDSQNKTHIYDILGAYTVKITGILTGWSFVDSSDGYYITNISQWGAFKLGTTSSGYFYGATRLTITAQDIPSLKGTTSMFKAFASCSSLITIPNIEKWDIATVTDMSYMFQDASAFNQPLNLWNTAAVTDMSYMFFGASAFNQPLNLWNTAAVTNMASMFEQAATFNKPLNLWNTAAVTNMASMFRSASLFNQDINQDTGSWNTAAVTNMAYMFNAATAFNNGVAHGSGVINPLTFNTAVVTDISSMFQDASAFNQPLNLGNTAAVTNMSRMFQDAEAFNQPLNLLNTAAVTDMSSMFSYALAFNNGVAPDSDEIIPLTFNTAAVTNMSRMFQNAEAFNQPLGSWDTSNVSNMSRMFQNALAFNKDISMWALDAVPSYSLFAGEVLQSDYRPLFLP